MNWSVGKLNGFNPFTNKPWFLRACSKSLLKKKTVGKGEIARNEQFLLFPRCFLPIWITLCHFYQIQNCGLQTLLSWKSIKFVIWERVNRSTGWCKCLWYPGFFFFLIFSQNCSKLAISEIRRFIKPILFVRCLHAQRPFYLLNGLLVDRMDLTDLHHGANVFGILLSFHPKLLEANCF